MTYREQLGAGGERGVPGRLAVVFLGGAYEEADFYVAWANVADSLIAADAGAAFLTAQGLRPDIVVGDLDSLSADSLEALTAAGVPVQRHRQHKDATDGELAVVEALRRGASEVVLAGALGALDHTLGHLAILWRLAGLGVQALLVSPGITVRVFVAPSEHILEASSSTRVSIVPLQGDATVSLRGMEYPLARGLLPADRCLGLGNVVGRTALPAVTVHDGAVAVYLEARTAAPGRKARDER